MLVNDYRLDTLKNVQKIDCKYAIKKTIRAIDAKRKEERSVKWMNNTQRSVYNLF